MKTIWTLDGRWQAGGQEQACSYLAPPPPPAPPSPPPPAAPSAVVSPPPLFPSGQETLEGCFEDYCCCQATARTTARSHHCYQEGQEEGIVLEVTTAITPFTLDSRTPHIWWSNWNFRNKDEDSSTSRVNLSTSWYGKTQVWYSTNNQGSRKYLQSTGRCFL